MPGPSRIVARLRDVSAVETDQSQVTRGSSAGGAIAGGMVLGSARAVAGALLGGGHRSRNVLAVAASVDCGGQEHPDCIVTFWGPLDEVMKARMLFGMMISGKARRPEPTQF